MDTLTNAGVDIRFFRPPALKWLGKRPGFFPRDHRKILIIDNHTTFVGGVCIYDTITHWRDTMVEISGSITGQFTHIFEGMWQKISGDKETVTVHPDFETNNGFSVYANAPDSQEHHFTHTLLEQINKAEHSIKMTTPYFTPDDDTLLPALIKALERGVKVELLLSNYSHYAAYVVGKTVTGTLIEHGAHIYYYEPTMLHLKMMVIDGTWAAIGSCNLDGLSIHQNQEAMLIATHPPFVQALDMHFGQDKARSVRFSYADWQARPISQKLAGWMLLAFRHYL